MVLELFAQGNIVLCDHAWTVLTLLRSHRDDAQNLQIMPNHVYPLAAARAFTRTPQGVITQLLIKSAAAGGNVPLADEPGDAAPTTEQAAGPRAQRKRGQQSSANDPGCVHGALNAHLPYGPGLLEHCLTTACIAPSTPLPLATDAAEAVEAAVTTLEAWFESTIKEGAPPPKGYLIGHTAAASADAASDADVVWDDFTPFPPAAAESPVVVREFPFLDGAVDTFFGAAELHRVASARVAAETAALSKVDRMRADQAARAAALEAEATTKSDHATLVEYNLSAVDAALKAVNDALATGMDWPSLHRLVKDERKAGNPVAGLITNMDLAKGTVTLMLGNVLDWEAEDDGDAGDAARTRPASVVTLRLDLSAAGNAREMHAARKKHQAKAAKTLEAAAQTLTIAGRKASAAVAAARAGATHGGAAGAGVTLLRQPCWWEKYTWFLTSENALVLSGRDPGQTATLLRRHLGPDDAIVTCDVAGAPLCIVKPPPPMPERTDGASQPLAEALRLPPPLSLHQAGTWCVCRSAAWNGKFSSSGWWAPASAVLRPPEGPPSKAQGELPPGAVPLSSAAPGWGLTRGARRDLPPSQLVLGFGVMFRVSDECVGSHLGERCIRSALEEDAAEQGAGGASGGDSTQPEEEVAPSGDEAEEHTGDDTASGEEEGEGEGEGEDEHQEEGGGEEFDGAADSGESSESEPESDAPAAAPKALPPAGRGKAARSDAPPPAAVPRGKQAKLKKLKDKYGEQDEEDRALAMAALASGGKSKKQKAAEAEAARKAAAAAEASRRAEAKAAAAAARGAGKGRGKGDGGGVQGAAADDDDEEDDAAKQVASAASLQELHALTGTPRAEGDVLLYAVPVCGPYAALTAFKFKAKVTPGSTKKGKAAKQCLDSFARAVMATPRERELLHGIPDMEGVAALCVPSGLKLSLTTIGKIGPPLTLGGKAKQQPVKKQRGEKAKTK